MAELVHLSPDHFARQFKTGTGLAPYQFVIARRVERAQELLSGRQELSLAEVAVAAGFSDQSQLCLHFKRIGATPGTFSGVEIRYKRERVPPIQGAVVPRLFSTMKIGFICPNLPSHINPMSAPARHLPARGHDVVFLYLSSANGLPCIPGDKRDDLNANRPEMSQLEGNEALAFYCGVAAKETEAIFKSWPRMLEKTGVEALVLDPIQFFVELAAMKLRIPYVTVANALYIDFSGYTPAGIFGWPHENTPDALARNLQAVTEAVRFCYNEGIKSFAKELGFKADLDHPSWIFSELAYITQLPKEVEHPLLPPQFHLYLSVS
jgi:AraC-like DNA-binding protein